MSEPQTQLAIATKTDDLLAYVKAANQGDKNALTKLRKELSGSHADALIASVGDLAYQVERAALERLGDQEGAKAAVQAKLGRMRRELGWGASSGMERLLIERVAQTWLHLQLLELADAQSFNRPPESEKYGDEKIARAERRHLNAIKTLAQVRKMALPMRIDLSGSLNVSATQSSVIEAARPSTRATATIE